jgi:type III secretion protein V
VKSILQKISFLLIPSGNRSEIVTVAIVIAILLAMIVPMPTRLLDILIAISISASIFLIVIALQLRDPLGLTSFPSLLLLTTLLRLSLSIASTRLILLDAHAGDIITAFGEVTVGGNLVVGLVIFVILTIVQFLVITKGAERVAEVSARFTLDGMPGKQMAIDMELRAGSLTADQARQKRAALSQETQFFGAMDGAMKFVKGDAIAGILIVIINIIGGLSVGVLQRGLPASEALHVYSILTIGDGLVAQIPALLTSLTAGMIVTRVSNSGPQGPMNIGQEIFEQVSNAPRAWTVSGAAIVIFGLVPGMPLHIFGVAGLGLIAVGTLRTQLAAKAASRADNGVQIVPNQEEFSITENYLFLFREAIFGDPVCLQMLNMARSIRNKLVLEYGMFLPPISVGPGKRSDSQDYEFMLDEVAVFSGAFKTEWFAVECQADVIEHIGSQEIVEERIEYSGRSRYWIPPRLKERFEQEGINPVPFWDVLSQRIEHVLWRTGYRYLGLQETQTLIGWLQSKYPDLTQELNRILPPVKLAEVLQKLLAERISIRNIRLIGETLVEWGQRERDTTILIECVRTALKRQICMEFASERTLYACLLDPEYEHLVRSSLRQTSYGTFINIDQEQSDLLIDGLQKVLYDHSGKPYKLVLLTAQDIRIHIRSLIEENFFAVPVLSYTEIASDYKVQPIGVIGQELE